MKEDLINRLIELLEHEHKVYEGILKLSKDKTNIVVEGKVSELENMVKLEQALLLQISRIDKQREEILVKISSELKLKENGVSISEIKKHVSPEQHKKLENYQKKMTDMVNELNHVNQLNSRLIKNSLEFIEFSLNLVSNADLTSNNYSNKGDSSETERKNLFDMKL